jgi:hypothetical protein
MPTINAPNFDSFTLPHRSNDQPLTPNPSLPIFDGRRSSLPPNSRFEAFARVFNKFYAFSTVFRHKDPISNVCARIQHISAQFQPYSSIFIYFHSFLAIFAHFDYF